MAVEGQSDKTAFDMEVCMKQRCVTEFLCGKKIVPTEIHQQLLNIYGNETLDFSTVKQWWCILAVAVDGHLHCCRCL